MRAPSLSSLLTYAVALRPPWEAKASTIAAPINFPCSSLFVMATAVGPAPLMVHPYAPAFLAAAVTAPIPGIRGALCGSTIVSDAEVKHKKKTHSVKEHSTWNTCTSVCRLRFQLPRCISRRLQRKLHNRSLNRTVVLVSAKSKHS